MATGGAPLKFTEARRQRFLEEYSQCGLLQTAAHAVNISPATVYEHLKHNEEFRAQFDERKRDFLDILETEAKRRAVEGVDEAIYQRGELMGYRKVYSDQLLTLLLKRHIPEYREKITADLNHAGAVLVVPGISEDSSEWEKRNRAGGSPSDEEDAG